MIIGRALPRRTFLRGMGTAVALPFLDAMTPAFASASKPITRVAFIYTANGVIMSDWTPPRPAPASRSPRPCIPSSRSAIGFSSSPASPTATARRWGTAPATTRGPARAG